MIRQRIYVLLLQFFDLESLGDLILLGYFLFLVKLGASLATGLSDEPMHVRFHVWLFDDVNDSRSFFFVLYQKQVYQVLHALAISVGDRLLLVLHYFENQAKQVLRMEGVLQSAELV